MPCAHGARAPAWSAPAVEAASRGGGKSDRGRQAEGLADLPRLRGGKQRRELLPVCEGVRQPGTSEPEGGLRESNRGAVSRESEPGRRRARLSGRGRRGRARLQRTHTDNEGESGPCEESGVQGREGGAALGDGGAGKRQCRRASDALTIASSECTRSHARTASLTHATGSEGKNGGHNWNFRSGCVWCERVPLQDHRDRREFMAIGR